VRRVEGPPSAGIVQTSNAPLLNVLYAIHFPSGENFGASSPPGLCVKRTAVPPSVPTV
jgi:hypothetical protein